MSSCSAGTVSQLAASSLPIFLSDLPNRQQQYVQLAYVQLHKQLVPHDEHGVGPETCVCSCWPVCREHSWRALFAGLKPAVGATALSQGIYFTVYSMLRQMAVVSIRSTAQQSRTAARTPGTYRTWCIHMQAVAYQGVDRCWTRQPESAAARNCPPLQRT